MSLGQALFLCLILVAVAKLGGSCSCAKGPSAWQAERAVVNGADAFSLSNACYERLGGCAQAMGWSGLAQSARVKDVGRRRTDGDTKVWWPVTAELDVLCRCEGRSQAITVAEKVFVTGDAKSGWRTTNAL